MHYNIILFLVSITLEHINCSETDDTKQISSSLLSKLTTKEFTGNAVQTIVTSTLSDYNSKKRERTFLEKNIRNVAKVTGQTGKTAVLITEVGESSVHFVIDKSIPAINKITESSENIKNKISESSENIKNKISESSENIKNKISESINYHDIYSMWNK